MKAQSNKINLSPETVKLLYRDLLLYGAYIVGYAYKGPLNYKGPPLPEHLYSVERIDPAGFQYEEKDGIRTGRGERLNSKGDVISIFENYEFQVFNNSSSGIF